MLFKNCKVDNKNRMFLAEWTKQYYFTLPKRVGTVPVHLICNSTFTVVKYTNLKRHYETMHRYFNKKFSLSSAAHKGQIHTCLLSYENSMIMFRTVFSGHMSGAWP